MKTNLNFIKSIKGMNFEGIYGKILHIYNDGEDLIIHCSKPLISFQTSQGDLNERFWLLEWKELKTGDDTLLINELQTPEPFEYEVIDSPHQKYIISASSYYTRKSLIKNIWGYGFIEPNEETLTTLVLELEELFINIEASPATEIRITKDQPNIDQSLSLLVSS
jgi:hypothetical protein